MAILATAPSLLQLADRFGKLSQPGGVLGGLHGVSGQKRRDRDRHREYQPGESSYV